MSQKRKDKRGRLLNNGETQDPLTGEYRFSYYVDGKRKNFRSWRLNPTDPTPTGKKKGLSLREKISQYEKEKQNKLDSEQGNMSVYDLCVKYVSAKENVKNTTRNNYKTVLNFLKTQEFGKKKIKNVTTIQAMDWLHFLQASGTKKYSSIQSIRGVLRPAFRKAVQSGWINKNPFDDFEIHEVLVNDSVRRDSICINDERRFLEFVKNDKHFSRYYEGFYILFNTGMRISEFCGLTLDDLDMKKRTININKQLQRVGTTVYIEDSAKTNAGSRIIPMEDGVYDAFVSIIEKRKLNSANPCVDGFGNFLYLDKNNNPSLALHWEHYFQHAREKFNKIYKDELPLITPHVARHTYCSKKAKAGINPVHLAYLMGHAETDITLGTYTHTKFEDAVDELKRIGDIQDTEF